MYPPPQVFVSYNLPTSMSNLQEAVEKMVISIHLCIYFPMYLCIYSRKKGAHTLHAILSLSRARSLSRSLSLSLTKRTQIDIFNLTI